MPHLTEVGHRHVPASLWSAKLDKQVHHGRPNPDS